MRLDREREIPRRQFVRSAVAIGGTSALAACANRERTHTTDGADAGTVTEQTFPTGDPDAVPAGQHEWSQFLVRDVAGNTVPPQQQLVLGLRYEGSSPPTSEERRSVAAALDALDRGFQWGTGRDDGATFNRGLLTMVGYAPSYFAAVGEESPVMRPETLLERVGEDTGKTDGFDAVAVLTSDLGSVVLAAEQALLGERDSVNGVAVDGSLADAFSVVERRTGFAGQGLPADKLDEPDIPDAAPLTMGFKSGFTDSLPPEDAVTIREKRFAGGSTLALSRLRIDLDRWYDQSESERVAEMFCPAHDTEEVGPVGTNLGDDSGITREDVDAIPEHADEHGRLGHAQKVATARDEAFEATILRRSEGFATDAPEHTGFNFTSVQRELADFVETRKAMNVDEYDHGVAPEDHGIVDFVTTVDRGTYVVPPRDDRALPVEEA